jgi:aminoglycoside phosphotransferase (APT) family kinase protein
MLTNRLEIPVDHVLGDWRERLAPARVLEVCKADLLRVAAEVRASWRDIRVVEALYHPGRYLRIAYVLLADPSTPPERQWPEGQVVYLHTPLRQPLSRRGQPLCLNGINVEAYSFPNDRRLRGMRNFAGRADAAATWQRWIDSGPADFDIEADSLQRLLMRYVPEQKWIIRLRAEARARTSGETKKRRIAVRSALPNACLELERRHRALARWARQMNGDLMIPDVVGCDADEGLLAVEWLRGDSLLKALRVDPAPVLRRVAVALFALHRIPPETCRAATLESSATLVLRVREAVEDLAVAYPDFRARFQNLADEFAGAAVELPTTPPVTLHNDFHWNQVTIRSSRVVVLDLERIGLGDPLLDVANFVTQLRMLSVRGEPGVAPDAAASWVGSFLHEWQRAGGERLDPVRMRLYSAVSLLDLARGMMRHLRADAATLAKVCLENCERGLAGEVAGVCR